MRDTDRPEPTSTLGAVIPKVTPVSKEPMWTPIAGQEGYMRATDGSVKKVIG